MNTRAETNDNAFHGHDVYHHGDAKQTICVWDGSSWYVPYDVGGEGVECTLTHHTLIPRAFPTITDEEAGELARLTRETQASERDEDGKTVSFSTEGKVTRGEWIMYAIVLVFVLISTTLAAALASPILAGFIGTCGAVLAATHAAGAATRATQRERWATRGKRRKS